MSQDSSAPPHVLAVLVSPGRTRYLSDTLRGLAGQLRPPDAVLVVDVLPDSDPGNRRASQIRAAAQAAGLALESVRLVRAPDARTFGAGVGEGLAELARQPSGGERLAAAQWLWFLHDDSSPEPDALAALLVEAQSDPLVVLPLVELALVEPETPAPAPGGRDP